MSSRSDDERMRDPAACTNSHHPRLLTGAAAQIDAIRAELADAKAANVELVSQVTDNHGCSECGRDVGLEHLAGRTGLCREHAEKLRAELAEANARVAELESLAELGRIAVVFAKDCVGDDCMMCAPNVNGAHHDECPVGLYLAKAEAAQKGT